MVQSGRIISSMRVNRQVHPVFVRRGGTELGRVSSGASGAWSPDHESVQESQVMKGCILVLLVLVMAATREKTTSVPAFVATPRYPRPGGDEHPVRLIFDTDVGNDIDDALALGVIHALQDRGECQLLAVTITKDDNYSAPFVDLVNTFYGCSGTPVGVVKHGMTPEDGRYTRIVCQARDNGDYRYPRHLASNKDATEAVSLMRRSLACQPDRSVVFVVTGFSTNLARLLESSPDEHSSMPGQALVARKCRLLSIMAGMYSPNNNHKEYNVVTDLPSARRVFAEWPTPIVASGFEIGLADSVPRSRRRTRFLLRRAPPSARSLQRIHGNAV